MTKATCANSTGAFVAHPPAGAPFPGSPANPSPHRRSLLAGLAAAALVAPVPVHAEQIRGAGSLAQGTSGDPVVALEARWRVAEAAAEAADQRYHTARANGSPLLHLMEESDRLNTEATAILDRVMATPAVSPAGALAKLRMAASVWPLTKPAGDFEFHEDLSRDAILDAVRLLAGAPA